jgi:hypothetical protein
MNVPSASLVKTGAASKRAAQNSARSWSAVAVTLMGLNSPPHEPRGPSPHPDPLPSHPMGAERGSAFAWLRRDRSAFAWLRRDRSAFVWLPSSLHSDATRRRDRSAFAWLPSSLHSDVTRRRDRSAFAWLPSWLHSDATRRRDKQRADANFRVNTQPSAAGSGVQCANFFGEVSPNNFQPKAGRVLDLCQGIWPDESVFIRVKPFLARAHSLALS